MFFRVSEAPERLRGFEWKKGDCSPVGLARGETNLLLISGDFSSDFGTVFSLVFGVFLG